MVKYLAITALCTVVFVLITCLDDGGPAYQGRHLRRWLQELGADQPTTVRSNARNAVLAMGSNAMPALVDEIAPPDPKPFRSLLNWIRASLGSGKPNIPIDARMRNAALGFEVLGEDSVPTLLHLITEQRSQELAYDVLSRLGDRIIGALMREASSTNPDVRCEAALFIGNRRMSLAIAIPALTNLLTNRYADVRQIAVVRLGRTVKFGSVPHLTDATVRSICPLVTDWDPNVRISACRSLAEFGSNAMPAKEYLEKALSDHDPQVRGAAESALRDIVPEEGPARPE